MKRLILFVTLNYFPVFTNIADYSERGYSYKRGLIDDSASVINAFVKASCGDMVGFDKNSKSPNGDLPSDTFEFIVRNAGYNVKLYKVETSDGYINSLFRIFKGDKEPDPGNKGTPVLFMHGILGSPKDWVLNDKDKVLPYRLVEDGRDVFVGANRGTPQSREHKTLDAEKMFGSAYWSFSFMEFAKYDIPSFADKMEDLTGEKQIYYVGYAQGAKQFFAWMAMGPKSCSRIKAMFALAPVCFEYNTRSPIARAMSLASTPAGIAIAALGSKQFLGTDPFFTAAKTALCSAAGSCPICDNLMMALGGFNPGQVNKAWQSMILAAVPASTSTQTVVHSSQETLHDRFGYFDFGPLTNAIKYGFNFGITPPQLHVGLMRTMGFCHGKVNILYSENDWLSDTKDTMKLKDELGPVLKNMVKVEDPSWNHYDYLWGKDTDKFVINPLITMLKSYDALVPTLPTPS